MLSCAAEELPLITLSDNIIEQDANTMWESALRTAKTALQAENVSPMQIEAVSISSQGISLIPVSYEGNTLYNAISWLDTRATNETEALIDRYGEQKLFTQTGKRPSSLYTLPKLLWIKKHHPELYHKTWKFMLPMDYMLYRLCGVCATDHTMASRTMMYDIISRRWAAEMIDELGLDIEKLPEILEAGAPIGTVRPEVAAALGLRRDVTVGVGGQDQKCAALGAGLDRNTASASLGTGCCVSALYMKPRLDPYMRIPCFAYLNDAQWVLEGVLNTAGACYEWFRNNFAPQYAFAQLNKLACETSGPAREMFFPYLAGGDRRRAGAVRRERSPGFLFIRTWEIWLEACLKASLTVYTKTCG